MRKTSNPKTPKPNLEITQLSNTQTFIFLKTLARTDLKNIARKPRKIHFTNKMKSNKQTHLAVAKPHEAD